MNGMAAQLEGNVGSLDAERSAPRSAWVAFILTFGLMMSDYVSRQVLLAVFPYLKAEWGLTDTQLGSLVSILAVMVGVLTIPISFMADRMGRVKSIAAMACLWSLATIACGLAANYGQMFAARAVVGIGEAAYVTAGGAILMHAFPAKLRSTVMGIFWAGHCSVQLSAWQRAALSLHGSGGNGRSSLSASQAFFWHWSTLVRSRLRNRESGQKR
jgi:MFS family permease